MAPFAADQINLAGPSREMSPHHALALSLALHELGTNAAKYGALSVPEGRIHLTWRIDAAVLQLDWRESGGPPVTPPSRHGFGSRLLEEGLVHDLGSETKLDYTADGVRCAISALL